MIYPIGIQDFEKLRDSGYVYVDKTALVYKLASEGSYYFLSRPRRFGKSLLLSTLEAYFSGKRELFGGLAIEKLESEWAKYPILHLDLNTANYREPDSLRNVLNDALAGWEACYGASPTEVTPELRFKGVVRRACEQSGRRVVILVDEYDKPMLQAIGDAGLQEEHRATLKAFYSVLKTQDRYIRFAFLTGVTKFGKVSVFSDLNNLKDISRDERYATICGVTEGEIGAYFAESMRSLAARNGLTYDEACARLRRLYDGYHFEHGTEGVYNPFSLLNTLDRGRFGNYWFETGTPTFLVRLLQGADYRLSDLQEEQVSADLLDSIDSMSVNPVPVIYQSGYLTIKDYDPRFGMYTLGFPNEEVAEGFAKYLLPFYAPMVDYNFFRAVITHGSLCQRYSGRIPVVRAVILGYVFVAHHFTSLSFSINLLIYSYAPDAAIPENMPPSRISGVIVQALDHMLIITPSTASAGTMMLFGIALHCFRIQPAQIHTPNATNTM